MEGQKAHLERAFAYTDTDYAAAQQRARGMSAQVSALFEEVDVIVGPTVGFVAPTLAEAEAPDASARLVRFTRLWNAVRFPAISVPIPTPGLPIGIQIAARDDAGVLAAAAELEQALR